MDTTPNLDLPYIASAQAQKHVTHNEAIRALDALVQLSVIDRDLTSPPATPANGDRYIVPAGASGAWSGHAGSVAAFQDGTWAYYSSLEGWLAWVADEDRLVAWDGTQWVVAGGQGVNPTPLVGINATADTTNRLTTKSNAVLFSHDDVTPGTGDMRQILNKSASSKTVSQLYQSNWSGRAETGLAGDDNWHLKVSPDGSAWQSALVVDRSTGETAVRGLKSIPAGNARANSVIFTPGGDGVVSIYRVDTTTGQNPRTATIASISGDMITVTTPVVLSIFGNMMTNVVFARIWNTTKSAAGHSAWASHYVGPDQFRVTSAAAISGWSVGDTIQLGDPLTITPNRCITLDISPMLTNLFGAAFRQTGIIVKSLVTSVTGTDQIAMSAAGVNGSFVTAATGVSSAGVTMIPCTELSPISNSNLVRVRETFAGTAGVRLLSSMAVLL